MEYLRTPESRFDNIHEWPYEARYVGFRNMRMHYADEGNGEIILCLHGEPTWGYLYRRFIELLSPEYRVVVPDMLGFGKSDKPMKLEDYTYHLHFESLRNFIRSLNLRDITLVCQDWGGLLGLGLLGEEPELFKRVVIMNTYLPVGKGMPLPFKLWRAFSQYSPFLPVGGIIKFGSYKSLERHAVEAYNAPFPSSTYKAGARAFPALVPADPHNPAVPYMLQARKVLKEWRKPALVMFSDKDPIMKGGEKWFYNNIPSAKEQDLVIIRKAGHFLQEDKPDEICGHIDAFMKKAAV